MEHLIPQHLFIDLGQPALLGLLVVSLGALILGADWLVDGASGLAIRAGIPKIIVGATIVSLGTTSPECAVSVTAAWSGEPGLALGNAVGSVIVDTALIFGMCSLIVRLPADRFVLNRHGWVQLGCGVLLAGLCGLAYWRDGDDAVIGRNVGIGLLALLAMYLAVSIYWSRQHPHGEPFQTPDELARKVPVTPETQETQKHVSPGFLVGLFVVGLVIVLLSSRVLVGSVTVLAERWGMPQVVIAATLVAFGTSLPELMVGVASVVKGHRELLVGNVLGADILNVLFVVGASAAAAPLPIVEDGHGVFLYLHLPAMLAVLVVFRVLIQMGLKRGQFPKWSGLPLLAMYIAYTFFQFVS